MSQSSAPRSAAWPNFAAGCATGGGGDSRGCGWSSPFSFDFFHRAEGAMRKFKLHGGKSGSALTVRVTPRARRTEVAEILEDGTSRVRVAAPPVEGKAKAALMGV